MKQIYMLRHGESEFNVWVREYRRQHPENKQRFENLPFPPHLRDSLLTKAGRQQARGVVLSEHMLGEETVVIVSPMRRALETCDIAVSTTACSVIVSPLAREHVDSRCERGTDTKTLLHSFGHNKNLRDQLQSLPDGWWVPQSGCDLETSEEFAARMKEFQHFINSLPYSKVLVVTHSLVIEHLTGKKVKNCEVVPL